MPIGSSGAELCNGLSVTVGSCGASPTRITEKPPKKHIYHPTCLSQMPLNSTKTFSTSDRKFINYYIFNMLQAVLQHCQNIFQVVKSNMKCDSLYIICCNTRVCCNDALVCK